MSAVLDAEALIALERGDRTMWAHFKHEVEAGRTPVTHSGVIGQVWRNGSRQVRLARVLPGIETMPLDETAGRAAGTLLGAAGGTDVIDAALVSIAHDGDTIFTSDLGDITHLAEVRGLRVKIVGV